MISDAKRWPASNPGNNADSDEPGPQARTAKQDLVEHFAYLVDHAGLDTAERFLSSAEESFDLLAPLPEMGPQLMFRHPDLRGLRKWRVTNFENVLIFYQPDADGVTIVRVLHAARDWWTLLVPARTLRESSARVGRVI
jgi:toxin ParE1/3/4